MELAISNFDWFYFLEIIDEMRSRQIYDWERQEEWCSAWKHWFNYSVWIIFNAQTILGGVAEGVALTWGKIDLGNSRLDIADDADSKHGDEHDTLVGLWSGFAGDIRLEQSLDDTIGTEQCHEDEEDTSILLCTI